MIPLFGLIIALPILSFAVCHRNCSGNLVPYPFGFSDGCHIKLDCSTGKMKIGGFDLQNLTSQSILVNLPAKCNRPIDELSHLFGPNYSPTWRNALLLQNCSVPTTNDCAIPSTLLGSKISNLEDCNFESGNTHFDAISCYLREPNDDAEFLDLDKVKTKGNCSFLLSSIMVGDRWSNTAALDFQAVELGWWLPGNCSCVSDGYCTPVKGKPGYRCTCNEGYIGDAFTGGEGCRKGNEGLCGAHRFEVEECKRSMTKSSRKNKLLKYILAPIASVVVVAVVVFIFVLRRRGGKLLPASMFELPLRLEHERITYREIVRATNSFDGGSLIGRGSSASVYKGIFSNDLVAAVKVFDLDVQGVMKSFDKECQIMRNVRHRNLVKIITSCSNLEFKALVMAYMPNGNLENWLYSADCSLNIVQRFGIMVDVATAMEYLHEGYSSPIVHCDLKPSNILLDEDMVAHVGDFGIAKLFTQEQRIQQTKTLGTIGYIAPEYGSEGLVSTMVDVYSYGILLMEVLSRRKPTDEVFSGELTMRRWVSESFPNSAMRIIDHELLAVDDEGNRGRYESCLASAIELALECTADSAEARPNMKDVLVRIGKIKSNLSERESGVARRRNRGV